MQIISPHIFSTVTLDYGQYAVLKRCKTCVRLARQLIFDALKRDYRWITNQSMLPKHVIHFDRADVAASLSALLLEHNQVYELRSSFLMSTYIRLLSSAGLMYTKSACITSFGFSACTALAKERGSCSPFLDTIQCMHN